MLIRTLLTAALFAVLAPAAAAGRVPCVPGGDGPRCQAQSGKVTDVNDGDTLDVKLRGGGRESVRFIGVQAMELTRYGRPSRWRGECHAVPAARLVYRLARPGTRVRLTAQQLRRASGGRLLRSVAVRRRGRWVDLGEQLIRRGLGLWMNSAQEYHWNSRYNRLSQRAALAGRGMFDRDACGSGPDADADLRVWVMSDPIGDGRAELDGEWMAVHNAGAGGVDLSGWTLRNPSHVGSGGTVLPAGTRLGPGETFTLYTGHGAATSHSLFQGLSNPLFENSRSAVPGSGDGAYLLDPDGDYRAWLIYPCVVGCRAPHVGALEVRGFSRGPERATVTNVSAQSVGLGGLQLRFIGAYPLPADLTLAPGETLTVLIGGSPSDDSRLTRHIGYDRPYLPEAGGTVRLSTFDEVDVSCDSWGSGSC